MIEKRLEVIGFVFMALAALAVLSVTISAAQGPQPMGVTLNVTPINDTVPPGGIATYNVSVTSITDQKEYVNFTIEPERPGWTYTFNPEGFFLEPGETNYSILSMAVPGFASDGDYYHNVTADGYGWMDGILFLFENATYRNVRTTVRTSMVPTYATVIYVNKPPEVLYKWEKPDDTPGDGYTNVYPIPGENLIVNKYVVVNDPNGKNDIRSVVVRTFYPLDNGSACGCIPCNESNCCEPGAGACVLKEMSVATPLSSPEACEAATRDAYKEGLLTKEQMDEINALIADGTAWIYIENNTFNCSDPAGNYTVCVQAFDNESVYDCLANTFEYVSVVALRIDFNAVNYGDIKPNETSWVSPGTVNNDGNDPMDIVIEAWNMTSSGGDVIPASQLDAAILVQPPVEHWLALPPGVDFDVDIPGCGSVPINFSLHVPLGTPPGDYSGYIRLTGKHG